MKNKEIKNGLEGIGLLENQIGIIESKVDRLVESIVQKDFPKLKTQNIYCPFIYECEKSPFGYCVYNRSEDPALDDCLYCHEPYERK